MLLILERGGGMLPHKAWKCLKSKILYVYMILIWYRGYIASLRFTRAPLSRGRWGRWGYPSTAYERHKTISAGIVFIKQFMHKFKVSVPQLALGYLGRDRWPKTTNNWNENGTRRPHRNQKNCYPRDLCLRIGPRQMIKNDKETVYKGGRQKIVSSDVGTSEISILGHPPPVWGNFWVYVSRAFCLEKNPLFS